MVCKTFITALIVTCLVVSSKASPCKASPRTTTVASAETTTTTKIPSSATQTTDALSTESAITVTEASIISETTTVIDLSTTEGSLTVDFTSTVTGSDAVTTVATTTDSATAKATAAESTTRAEDTTTEEPTRAVETTTAAETTTTVSSPAIETYIVNGGFEDSSQSAAPWSLAYDMPEYWQLSVDTTQSHEGQNSVRMSYYDTDLDNYIRQPLPNIEAGIPYIMSAWVLPYTCSSAYVRCVYNGGVLAKSAAYNVPSGTGSTWQPVSGICMYTQDQVNSGGLYLYVGFYCEGTVSPHIDTVEFYKR